MKNILLVTSSPRGEASHSTRVARELVEKLKAVHPGATVRERDLWQVAPPMIDAAFTHAMYTPADQRSAEQRQHLSLSDELIAELKEADILVVASGMINFGVPSALKAWIDHISRAGETFRYGEAGPEGLLKGLTAYLVTASGGVYSQGPMQAMDFQTPFIKSVFSFLGIEVVETIALEGMAMGPEAAETTLESAHARIEALAA